MKALLTLAAIALALVLPGLAVAQCPGGSCRRPVVQQSYCPGGSCRPQVYAPAVQAQATAQLYQLADATGQAWQHADPAYLSAFVAQRNASLVSRPAYFAAPVSRCSGGRCR